MIDAFLQLKDGTLKRSQDVEEVIRLVEEAGEGWSLWLDLEAPPEEEFGLLKVLFNFHPLTLEDCLSHTHHPKIDEHDDHLFLIFHAVRWSAEDETFQTTELDCFVGQNFLVTYHQEPLPPIQEAKVRCLRKEEALRHGADYLLYVVIDALVDNYAPALDQIDEIIEVTEKEVFTRPTPSTLNRLFSLKKELARLLRTTLHQREILSKLSHEEFSVIRRERAVLYRDVYDHLVRACDLTESYLELITGAMNACTSVMSSRTNEAMKILAILASILLPISVIAGIYGMSFQFMPEFRWPYGYYGVLGFMACFAIGMLVFFRWKKWL